MKQHYKNAIITEKKYFKQNEKCIITDLVFRPFWQLSNTKSVI